MKEKYRDLKLSKGNIKKLIVVNDIIEEYAADDYVLTLRQLYYQLVSRDIIPNVAAEYAKLSKLLKEGRMAGAVDWDAIEDRLRVPKLPYYIHGVDDAINDTINQYRLDRMKGQDIYLEVWVEKDALSGVLERITEKYHIRLMVSRGYNSVTAIHDAYKRIRYALFNKCTAAKILYLGDHDPSGVDMIRDIESRVKEMLYVDAAEDEFTVDCIALTKGQINRFNPPPNPAKVTDPRAKKYISEHGNTSWEVDALNPRDLNNILSNKIEESINLELYKNVLMQEGKDKAILNNLKREL